MKQGKLKLSEKRKSLILWGQE